MSAGQIGAADRIQIRRALLSVSDKTGLVALAQALQRHGVEMVSTGGTAAALRGEGLPVREVSDLTGFPEMLDGRVKTLHPRIHAGLLAPSGVGLEELAAHGIAPFDLLVVNLYPFAKAAADPSLGFARVIEEIDVGGPAMLRAAAKNHARVTVVCDPADYPELIASLEAGCTAEERRRLAARAFAHTAGYDAAIASWFAHQVDPDGDPALPPRLVLALERQASLRYGENPHQAAALYRWPRPMQGAVIAAEQLQGKALSFNNVADADAAWRLVRRFAAPACVIVKHQNPCGVALAESPREAYERAHACDPVSAFGGILAFNRPLDEDAVHTLLARQFVEVLLAPALSEAATEALASKPKVRVLTPSLTAGEGGLDFRSVEGGLLVQHEDVEPAELALTVVTRRAPDPAEWRDLRFAWTVAAAVKSNAIVHARDGRTLGIGAGQMSRVDSARIAAFKAEAAGLPLVGAVMASDAFFPFRDGIDAAHAAGIRAVIQPGGSLRDAEVIAACDEHDMAMVFTGIRHFRH